MHRNLSERLSVNKTLSLLFKLAFVVAIFYWLLTQGHFEFKEVREALTITTVLSELAFLGIAYYCSSERLRNLLRIFSVRISSYDSFRYYLVGLFFNFVLPGGVGGDVMKGYYIYRNQDLNRSKVPITVVIDRLMGLYTIFFIGSVATLIEYSNLGQNVILLKTAQFCVATMLIISLAAILVFLPRVQNFLYKFGKRLPIVNRSLVDSILNVVRELYSSPKLLMKSFLLSALSQFAFMSAIVIGGHALGFTEIPFRSYLFITAIGFLVSAIPITPAGIGMAQAAFLFVANAYLDEATTLGPSATTIFQIVSLIWALAGGLIYVQIGQKKSDT